jgi:hypothetical protein
VRILLTEKQENLIKIFSNENFINKKISCWKIELKGDKYKSLNSKTTGDKS